MFTICMTSVTVTLHENSVAGIGSVSPRSVVREMFSKVPLKSPLGTSLPAFSCRVRISPVVPLMDYLDLVTVEEGSSWMFKPDAEQRLMKRNSLEFAVCFWLAMLKLNGSAPIDVALLREENVLVKHLFQKGNCSSPLRERMGEGDGKGEGYGFCISGGRGMFS